MRVITYDTSRLYYFLLTMQATHNTETEFIINEMAVEGDGHQACA